MNKSKLNLQLSKKRHFFVKNIFFMAIKNRTKVSELTVGELRALFAEMIDRALDEFLDGLDGQLQVEKWPEVMDSTQAAEYLRSRGVPGMEKRTRIYTLKNNGSLIPVRRGGKLGFPREELDRWLKGSKEEGQKDKADVYLNGS